MSLFDLSMINKYRLNRPSSEDLISLIAAWAGAYTPQPIITNTVEEFPPDPREAIRAAFAAVKFAAVDEVPNVAI